MRSLLAWLLLAQMGSSKPSSDSDNLCSRQEPEEEQKQGDTKLYVAWATDRNNVEQVKQTRTFLEKWVTDKSLIQEIKSFDWETAEDVPMDELRRIWNEGKFDQEIGKYEKLDGWGDLSLNATAFKAVKAKTEWIKSIGDNRVLTPSLAIPTDPMSGSEEKLQSRKVDWGDWAKQENAGKDLVQASRFEGPGSGRIEDI